MTARKAASKAKRRRPPAPNPNPADLTESEKCGWQRRGSAHAYGFGPEQRPCKVLVSLTEGEARDLKALAVKNGVPVAWYVRALVMRVLLAGVVHVD